MYHKLTVEDLKNIYPDLTTFQALQIAIELDRNQIIKDAFGVTSSDNSPKFLESLAIHLEHIGKVI